MALHYSWSDGSPRIGDSIFVLDATYDSKIPTKGRTTTWRHRIDGPGGLLAIVNCSGTSCNPTATTKYEHRDHLGSPELITNSSGIEVVKLSFGAFGERRDRDWHGAVSSADITAIGNSTRRGFTEHEHPDSVGFIHFGDR